MQGLDECITMGQYILAAAPLLNLDPAERNNRVFFWSLRLQKKMFKTSYS